MIGLKFDYESVQADMKLWPFEIINVDGKPKIQVSYNCESKSISPEQTCSEVFAELKKKAASFTKMAVRKAVITVPTSFNYFQRQLVRISAENAGLDVLRVITDSTAIAHAYCWKEDLPSERNILIFDLGAGSFEVSVVSVNNRNFLVKSTAGDNHLGGEDFDNRLMNYFIQEFKSLYKMDLINYKRALYRLKVACEQAKIALSTSTEATIKIENLFEGINFNTSITRTKFEELSSDLFAAILKHVQKAIHDARLNPESIDEIILAGGSSRIAKIKDLLNNFVTGKESNINIDRDCIPAYGAAIYGAILNGDISRDISSLDVTPMSLGIETADGAMNIIIERNTNFPTRQTKMFTTHSDNQTEILIQVYEGERLSVKDNNLLGQFELTEIPPAKRGVATFEITFHVDVNGILSVTALETSTNKEEKLTISSEAQDHQYLRTELKMIAVSFCYIF